jgi:hypothetical protein
MQTGINNNATYYFASSYTKLYMYYSNSNAKTQLNSWYTTYITNKGYSDYVASGSYFCQQAKTAQDSTYASNSGASMTVYSSYTANFKCSTDGNGYGLVNASIGLITYDELIFGGGYGNVTDSGFYLVNGSTCWTMSPAGYNGTVGFTWTLSYSSQVRSDGHPTIYQNTIRGVINLKADTLVAGEGTITQPYVVE